MNHPYFLFLIHAHSECLQSITKPCPRVLQTISLKVISPGAEVHIIKSAGKTYLSLVEIVMHLCDKPQVQAVSIYSGIPKDIRKLFQNELLTFIHRNDANKQQTLGGITPAGAIGLAKILPNKRSPEVFEEFKKILLTCFTQDEAEILKMDEDISEKLDTISRRPAGTNAQVFACLV